MPANASIIDLLYPDSRPRFEHLVPGAKKVPCPFQSSRPGLQALKSRRKVPRAATPSRWAATSSRRTSGAIPSMRLDQLSFGQNEAQQQGLLLARGADGGGGIFRSVDHEQVAPMRPFEGAGRRAVPLPAFFQKDPKGIFGLRRRALRKVRLHRAMQRQHRVREGRLALPRQAGPR